MARLLSRFMQASFFTPVQEVPAGAVNGTNKAFVLSAVPSAGAALLVTVNGVVLPQADYTLNSTTVTLGVAPSVDQSVYVYYSK